MQEDSRSTLHTGFLGAQKPPKGHRPPAPHHQLLQKCQSAQGEWNQDPQSAGPTPTGLLVKGLPSKGSRTTWGTWLWNTGGRCRQTPPPLPAPPGRLQLTPQPHEVQGEQTRSGNTDHMGGQIATVASARISQNSLFFSCKWRVTLFPPRISMANKTRVLKVTGTRSNQIVF